MRKFVMAAVLAAVASAALISTAGARDSSVTLNLIAHQTHAQRVGENRFAISGPLLKASDPSHRKGHFRAVFNRNNRIRAVAYLHNGKLKVDGHGNTVPIIAGTRHWEGATGTLRIHPIQGTNDARLNFHVH